MNHKDVWLLGLFAFAFAYLEAAYARPPAEAEEDEARAPAEELPVFPVASRGVVPRSACPRDLAHRVSLRGDGAMWCMSCDEGFFPQRFIWGTLMGGISRPVPA